MIRAYRAPLLTCHINGRGVIRVEICLVALICAWRRNQNQAHIKVPSRG